MISQSSVAHCGCNLHFMHPIWEMDTAAGRDNILTQSEECVVHICEIGLSNLPVDLMSQDTGHDNQIFLNVNLNQIPRGDVIYKKEEHVTWHECSQKVGTKWQTFMLNYCDQDKDVFQNFQLKLDAVIQKVNTVNPANLSYHLVAVEVKEVTCTTSSIASRIFDDDDNELLDEERLLLQSQSSCTESEDEYSTYSPEEEKSKICPELPPFEPAPYVLEGFHANTQEVTSLDVTIKEEKKIENVKNKNDSLCDSLHIPKTEFPQSFNSVLKSVEKSSSLYCGQGQCPNSCGKHYISDERLNYEDLYLPMIYTGKTDSASMEQRMKTNENQKPEEVQKLAQLLQTAINDKDVKFAQEYSKELATKDVEVKIDAKLKTKEAQEKEKDYDLKVYIEDKESSGGHITLKVRSADTIRDLKNRMLMKHMFPVEVQYWIIGKRMPKDNETLAQCKIRGQGHSVFLYLVSAKSVGIEKEEFIRRQANPGQEYMAPSPPEVRAPVVAVKTGNQPDKRKGSTPTLPVMKQASIPEENLNDKSKDKKKPTPVKVAPKQLPTIEPGLHDTGPEIARILRTIDPHLQAGINTADVYRPGNRIPVMHPEEPEPVFGWACDACTFINQPTRPGCEVCGNPRPEDYEVPPDYVMSEEESQRLQMEQLLEQKTKAVEEKARQAHYQEQLQNFHYLQETDTKDVIPNTDDFTCPICFDDIEIGDGVVLRECLHSFCRDCLREAVVHNEEPVLKCPYQDESYACDGVLQHREIKGVVPPGIYEKYLARGLAVAESQAKNSFHCKTADCPGWCTYEDHVNFFVCPVCEKENCLTCKAIHPGMNCKQYQEDLRIRATNDKAASQTQIMIKKMLDDGEAMSCPQCKVIVMKKEGCDWIQCSICKTEICWVTKQSRWGPMGNGDITGGCMCRVNGQQCHPECNNCH